MAGVEAQKLIQTASKLASRLPTNIRLGTSSWTFPGWSELVYHQDYKSKAAFTRDSLAEYGRCPLFRAVGVDSTYYRPPSTPLLDRLFAQAPNLQFVVKVWQEICSHRFSDNFLNPETFSAAAVKSFEKSKLSLNGSTLLLQFSRVPEAMVRSGEFLERLACMLEAAPRNIKLGIEVRNFSLISPEYLTELNRREITHVFSWSTEMPPLLEQLKAVALGGGIKTGDYIVRALIPPGFDYEATKADYSPFDAERRPDPQLHADLQRIIARARVTDSRVTVLFNNKAEGSAPLSVARTIIETLESEAGPG